MAYRYALLAVPILVMVSLAAHADEVGIVATPETVRDFMIQNVCLDAAGKVVSGQSPLDPGCTRQRDLQTGERLPYHKHDHPSPAPNTDAPNGYQRHDSFPVATAGFPELVEHSFDFGAGEGRHFGVFDRGSDGGDAAILSPGTVSIGATEDGGAGFQFFVGECSGPVTANALTHSWIVLEYDAARPAPLQGETVARLKDLRAAEQGSCPSRFNAAYTNWHVAPFRYRAAAGQGSLVTRTTLISEHYGGMSPATADHVERFYFTRELGGTRWERWQNVKGNALAGPQKIAEMAAMFAASGRCSPAPAPAGGAEMVLIDCREWTRIVLPADPAGDVPGFFIDAVRTRPDVPAFFSVPASAR